MKLLNTAVAGLLIATCSLLNIASATLITKTIELAPQSTYTSGGIISYMEYVNPADNVASDALFSLALKGDFNMHYENLLVNIDGYSLGIVLDNNPSNDHFDFDKFGWPGDDDIGSDKFINYGTATIDKITWASIVTDGIVNITLDASKYVGGCYYSCKPTFSSMGKITYDVTDVPEPTGLALLALGLIGLGLRRKAI